MSGKQQDGCCKSCGDRLEPASLSFGFCSIACYEGSLEVERHRRELRELAKCEERIHYRVHVLNEELQKLLDELRRLGADWSRTPESAVEEQEKAVQESWCRLDRRMTKLLVRAVAAREKAEAAERLLARLKRD